MKIFVYPNSLLTNVHGLTLFDAQARKTESSLLKIRQGAQRRAGASSDVSDHNVSDTDKICMQLFLDIQVNMVLVSNCSVLLPPPPPPLSFSMHFILFWISMQVNQISCHLGLYYLPGVWAQPCCSWGSSS